MMECPYCLSLIAENDEVVTCRVCGTPHHAECIEENGGCAIKDCEKLVRSESIEIEVDAEPKTTLVLSKEAVEKAPQAVRKKESNPCLKCGKQLPYGEIYCEQCAPSDPEKPVWKNWKVLLAMIVGIVVIAWITVVVLVGSPTNPIFDPTTLPRYDGR